MNKKKKDLTKDLSRGRSLKKEIRTTEEGAKKIVEKIVNPKPAGSSSKPLIRTTMDLPGDIHKAIKIKAAQDQISLKAYIIQLVKKDLGLD